MPALFREAPRWTSRLDADPVLAEATRQQIVRQAVSEKALVTENFPFTRRWYKSCRTARLFTSRPLAIIKDDVHGKAAIVTPHRVGIVQMSVSPSTATLPLIVLWPAIVDPAVIADRCRFPGAGQWIA